jgi:hypothetical protein
MAQIGDRGHQQRNCQGRQQAILEWIVQHRNPVTPGTVLTRRAY